MLFFSEVILEISLKLVSIMRIEFSLLLIFGVFLCERNVNATLTDCSSGAGGASQCDNPQDGYCDTALEPDSCRCNHLYTASDNTVSATCALKACSTPADDCGTNTICDTNDKCACLGTHEVTVASGETVSTCTRKKTDCSTNADCTGSPVSLANSYCVTGGSDNGCYCTATSTVSDTACVVKTCTQANIVITTCGSNTVCGLKRTCECGANYHANAATCTQKSCTNGATGSTLAGECGDSTSQVCTNEKCVCASDYVASGTMCKKNCSADADVCNSNADCIDGLCECRANYEGNGVTCTQLECSGSVTTNCHPNSQCSSDKCTCASGWTVNGTVCAKTCTGNSDCGSGSTAGSCNTTAGVCQCTATYVGDGVVCNQKECTANSDCTVIAHSTCNTTSNLCICTDGVDSNDPLLCSGASTVVYNFSFMLLSLLMATFFKKF